MSLAAVMRDDEAMRDEAPAASRRVAPALSVALLCALLAGGWLLLPLALPTEVRQLRIEAPLQRVEAEAVRAVLRPLLAGNVLELDVDAARAAVERQPWVARARVERQWPDTLRVRVWEREPLAHWGERRLLDQEARTFEPGQQDLPEGLPHLSGPTGSQRVVVDAFRELSARLESSPFALEGLSLDPRGEWSGRTRDGAALHFGRGSPARRLDALLGPVARALGDRMSGVEYIDLRYTNGFAVGWRKASPEAGGEANG